MVERITAPMIRSGDYRDSRHRAVDRELHCHARVRWPDAFPKEDIAVRRTSAVSAPGKPRALAAMAAVAELRRDARVAPRNPAIDQIEQATETRSS